MNTLVVVTVVSLVAWFGWVCEHAPIEESEDERRLREDYEVAALDAVWDAPAYDQGIHA